MLDLGAWKTVQQKDKKYHCQNFKQHDSLDRYVKKSWKNVEEYKLNKIWDLFIKFLDLIIFPDIYIPRLSHAPLQRSGYRNMTTH